MNEIDFTDCPRVPTRAYSGANGKKVAVSFENAVWLLKFPPSAAPVRNLLRSWTRFRDSSSWIRRLS